MLVAEEVVSRRRTLAEEAVEGERYVCPSCRYPVILKAGRIKIPHFAHEAGTFCQYGLGETMEHRDCKMTLYRTLRAEGLFVEIEKWVGPCVPDVVFTKAGTSIAIEVQRSHQTIDQIHDRLCRYAEQNLPVVWVQLGWNPEARTDQLSPKAWQRWLHTHYFGRVYCWKGGLDVWALHFTGHLLDSGRWSKRHRDAIVADDTLHLVRDFRPQFVTPTHAHLAGLPPLWLYKDTLRAWWRMKRDDDETA